MSEEWKILIACIMDIIYSKLQIIYLIPKEDENGKITTNYFTKVFTFNKIIEIIQNKNSLKNEPIVTCFLKSLAEWVTPPGLKNL